MAEPIRARSSRLMQGFVHEHTEDDAEVVTDEASGYRGLRGRKHVSINHSAGEYGPTNGIESFWSGIKRAHMGTYHKMEPKHLHRYTTEFQERHNRRPLDTLGRMESVVFGGAGKRLRFVDLTSGEGEVPAAPPPLPSQRPMDPVPQLEITILKQAGVGRGLNTLG